MYKNKMPVVLLEGGLQVRVPVVCFINFIGNSPLYGAVGLEEINFWNQRAEILEEIACMNFLQTDVALDQREGPVRELGKSVHIFP